MKFDLNSNLKIFNLPNNKIKLYLKFLNKIIIPNMSLKDFCKPI